MPNKPALKLQWDFDGPDAFDATGGEPEEGRHGTILEKDPADEKVLKVLEMTFKEAAELLPDMTIADWLNQQILFKLLPADVIKSITGRSARFILRKMDGDGKS